MLLPLLLPAFIHTHLPSFAHSHSSTPTHLLPLTAPVLHSRSPDPTDILPHSRLSTLVHHLYPSPRSLVRACLHLLICACSHLCLFGWPPFALVCAHLPHLFMLVHACLVVCPFSLCVASVHTHLCPLTPLTDPHLCLYQIYG